MPYRRLPNTDQARLYAIETAVKRAAEADYNNQALSYKTLTTAQRFLLQFETMLTRYRDNYKSKVNANKEYRHIVANARMYLSHFIQVLNLAIIRGEVKPEQVELYGLDKDARIVPDLSSEEDILLWGQRIIDGEKQRTAMGGFAIYNPPIAKVQVYYDIFKEHQMNHTLHKQTINRVHGDLGEYRKEADELILQIWNEVEERYKDKLPYERMCLCKEYGLIYYYRKGEKELNEATDAEIRYQRAKEQTIPWEN
jgi:hypothetical protein